jgi:hypothetical protein
MGTTRSLAGMCAAASGFGSHRYQLVQALADAIAALAEEVTGDPKQYAAKPHGG